jgi:hypothetical protein
MLETKVARFIVLPPGLETFKCKDCSRADESPLNGLAMARGARYGATLTRISEQQEAG